MFFNDLTFFTSLIYDGNEIYTLAQQMFMDLIQYLFWPFLYESVSYF